MKTITVLFLIPLLWSCSFQSGDSRLDGTWTSSKKLTLLNISENIQLTEQQEVFLNKSLGIKQFIHKGGKIAYNFIDKPYERLSFYNYIVYESDEKSVTFGFNESSRKIQIFFSGNCIFHETHWGVNEYFCKSKSV